MEAHIAKEGRFKGKIIFIGNSQFYNPSSGMVDPDCDEFEPRTELLHLPPKPQYQEISKLLGYCQGLFHFTDINKLSSIFELGYVASRNVAEAKGLTPADNTEIARMGNNLVDRRYNSHVRDYARLTFQSNNPILYHYQGIVETTEFGVPIPQPCILRFDPQVGKLSRVMFSRTNANSRNNEYSGDIDLLRRIPFYQIQTTTAKKYDRGSEVLYPVGIPVNHLLNLYFRSKAEMKYAKKKTDLNFPHLINKSVFGKGKNPTYLEDIVFGESGLEFDQPDKTQYSPFNSVETKFLLINPKQGQHVEIEVEDERGFKVSSINEIKELNHYNITTLLGPKMNHLKINVLIDEKKVTLYDEVINIQ